MISYMPCTYTQPRLSCLCAIVGDTLHSNTRHSNLLHSNILRSTILSSGILCVQKFSRTPTAAVCSDQTVMLLRMRTMGTMSSKTISLTTLRCMSFMRGTGADPSILGFISTRWVHRSFCIPTIGMLASAVYQQADVTHVTNGFATVQYMCS